MEKLALTLPGGYSIADPEGFAFTNQPLGEVITALLPYIFVLAGLLLFGLLIWGGFGLLTSAGNPDKVKSAQTKLTNAVIGFIIIFVSYWLIQILQIIFGIGIFRW
ncbi:hypothetical protein AMJ51_02325 [Microgenomates bacterium DG_75]|nr:MAG: hypothetical protein AMJ51_02325 [Microgenomates bacterium DG_75]